ncbi:MAG: AI-2E family transporter [Eubacteriales bacterium]
MTNQSQNTDKGFIEKVIDFIKQSIKVTFKYFWSKTLASIILGLIGFGFLSFIHVEHSAIMGAIIGITNLIPVIGGLAAALICVIIALFQSYKIALYVLITIVVLQQLDQWILTPVIVGKSVNLPSILIIISLLAGSWLWGPVGFLIAVPIAGMVKAFYTVFIKSDKKKNEVETIDINSDSNDTSQ